MRPLKKASILVSSLSGGLSYNSFLQPLSLALRGGSLRGVSSTPRLHQAGVWQCGLHEAGGPVSAVSPIYSLQGSEASLALHRAPDIQA